MHRFMFISCICMLFGVEAMAAAYATRTTPIESIDFSFIYKNIPSVQQARHGTSSLAHSIRIFDNPETPDDVRIAIIDAVLRARQTPRDLTSLYINYLKQGRQAPHTLAAIKTHQALALGYMLARTNPQTLRRVYSKTQHDEIDRVDAILLLNTAVNRHRGNLTIALIDGLIKAHLATVRPKDTLCQPHDCIDNALRPFTQQWSVRQATVCAITQAFPSPKTSKVATRTTPFARRVCAGHAKVDITQTVAQSATKTKTPNHQRFSSPTKNPSSFSGLNGTAQTHRLITLQRLIQMGYPPSFAKVILQNMSISRAYSPPTAPSSIYTSRGATIIDILPAPTQPPTLIPMDHGNTGVTGPGKEITLHPELLTPESLKPKEKLQDVGKKPSKAKSHPLSKPTSKSIKFTPEAS